MKSVLCDTFTDVIGNVDPEEWFRFSDFEINLLGMLLILVVTTVFTLETKDTLDDAVIFLDKLEGSEGVVITESDVPLINFESRELF